MPLCCCFLPLISNSGSNPLEPDTLHPLSCDSDQTNYIKTWFLNAQHCSVEDRSPCPTFFWFCRVSFCYRNTVGGTSTMASLYFLLLAATLSKAIELWEQRACAQRHHSESTVFLGCHPLLKQNQMGKQSSLFSCGSGWCARGICVNAKLSATALKSHQEIPPKA